MPRGRRLEVGSWSLEIKASIPGNQSAWVVRKEKHRYAGNAAGIHSPNVGATARTRSPENPGSHAQETWPSGRARVRREVAQKACTGEMVRRGDPSASRGLR